MLNDEAEYVHIFINIYTCIHTQVYVHVQINLHIDTHVYFMYQRIYNQGSHPNQNRQLGQQLCHQHPSTQKQSTILGYSSIWKSPEIRGDGFKHILLLDSPHHNFPSPRLLTKNQTQSLKISVNNDFLFRFSIL